MNKELAILLRLLQTELPSQADVTLQNTGNKEENNQGNTSLQVCQESKKEGDEKTEKTISFKLSEADISRCAGFIMNI